MVAVLITVMNALPASEGINIFFVVDAETSSQWLG